MNKATANAAIIEVTEEQRKAHEFPILQRLHVPCDPYEERAYDISNDKFEQVTIVGWDLAVVNKEPPAVHSPVMRLPTKGGDLWIIAAPATTKRNQGMAA